MEELQVPTRKVRVQVRTEDGRAMIGDLFLADSRFDSTVPTSVARLLNDDRTFLPFVPENDGESPAVINKRHIARVRVDPATVDDTDDLDCFPCTLQLGDGSALEAGIVVETPLHDSRLLDKMNHAPRFVTIVAETGLEFIRVSHIVCVQ